MKIFLRWLITVIALFAATLLVPGISVESNNAWVVFSIMAVILALVNAFVRPILKLLSCGFIIITLGLFVFVINAATLLIASNIAQSWFNVPFVVDGFGAALLGSIIVSIVSVILSSVLIDDKE